MNGRFVAFDARSIIAGMPVPVAAVAAAVTEVVPVMVIKIPLVIPGIVPGHIKVKPDTMVRTICPG
jgi:hypothetical protein